MKRILRFLAVGVLSLLLAVCFISCGDETNGEIELSVKESSQPNTTFVLGQDVNLAGGVLLVKEGDSITEVKMTGEGVSVSGYDKNKLGEQTVTVTYLGKSVTVNIKYVERMTASDYTTEYLCGDEFDIAKGKLKITRDNGTSFTVSLSSSKVKIDGFDPQKIGEQTVSVKYQQNNDVYSTSFKVTVYEIEQIKLINPNKITYKSHDTALSAIGGQLVLTGKGGELKSSVRVTEDMISGFDLSAANRENSPLTQTLKVHYNGVDYPYDIKITYTPVSDFCNVAKGLSSIDFAEWDNWSDPNEIPKVDDALGKELVYVMQLYLDEMSAEERELLNKNDVKNAARAAIIWAYGNWFDDMILFGDAFTVVGGSIQISAKSENAVKEAITELEKTDRDIYNYSDIICDLVTRFANESVYKGITFSAFPTIPNEDYKALSAMFEYMLALDELIDKVPKNWEELGVEQFGSEIAAIFDKIVNGGYYTYANAQLYAAVSSWRKANDVFDFMFNYYYEKEDLESLVILSNVSLPKDLKEIFDYIYMALECAQNVSAYKGNTTRMFYGYYMAEHLSTLLLLGSDSMQKELFYLIPLNGMLGIGNSSNLTEYTFYNILEYLRTMPGGYYYFSAGLLGNEGFEAFMDEYMYVLRRWNTDAAYKVSAEFSEDVEGLLRLYMDLDPSEQASLAVTLNVFHGTEHGAPYLFDATGEHAAYETQFAAMLRVHYQGLFDTNAGKDAYVALMTATEVFAQRYTINNWQTVYNEKMALVESMLSTMSTEEQALFGQKFNYILEKYDSLIATSSKHKDTTSLSGLDLKGWEDEFEQLRTALVFTELGMLYTQNNIRYYNIFLAAYERAERIATNILLNAPEEVVEIYYYAGLYSDNLYYEFFGQENPSTEEITYMSYQYIISVFRSHYMNAINQGILKSSIYDEYVADNGLKAFLEKSYDLLIPFLHTTLLESDKAPEFDSAKMVDLIYAFSRLDTYSKIVFLQYMDDTSSSLFSSAFMSFTNSEYTSGAASLIQSIINFEFSYMVYDYNLNVGTSSEEDIAKSLEAVKSGIEELKREFGALAGEDEASFAPFVNLYNEIVERTDKAIADAENGEADE